jgi:hypothetical protein
MTTFNECSLPPTSVFGIQNHTNRSKRKKKSTAFDFVKCCINLFQQSEKWILRFPRLESWIGFTRVGPTSMHVCKVKNENIQVRICPHPNLECCMFVKRHRSASNGQVDVEIVQHAINFCPILLLLDAMHLIYWHCCVFVCSTPLAIASESFCWHSLCHKSALNEPMQRMSSKTFWLWNIVDDNNRLFKNKKSMCQSLRMKTHHNWNHQRNHSHEKQIDGKHNAFII